jgi:hypothetical protein
MPLRRRRPRMWNVLLIQNIDRVVSYFGRETLLRAPLKRCAPYAYVSDPASLTFARGPTRAPPPRRPRSRPRILARLAQNANRALAHPGARVRKPAAHNEPTPRLQPAHAGMPPRPWDRFSNRSGSHRQHPVNPVRLLGRSIINPGEARIIGPDRKYSAPNHSPPASLTVIGSPQAGAISLLSGRPFIQSTRRISES